MGARAPHGAPATWSRCYCLVTMLGRHDVGEPARQWLATPCGHDVDATFRGKRCYSLPAPARGVVQIGLVDGTPR